MGNQLSRRAAMTALTAGIASAALLPATAAVASVIAPDTTEWDKALAAVQGAEAAISSANQAEEDADIAYAAACSEIEPKGLTGTQKSVNYQLNRMPLDAIAEMYSEPHASATAGYGAEIVGRVSAYRDRCAALRASFRINELEEATSDACTAWGVLNDTALLTPAPTIAALADKLALFLLCDPTEDHINVAIADARRLAGREARA